MTNRLSAGWPVFLLCVGTALAQKPQQDPIINLMQAAAKARSEGRFEDAVARREEARGLLERLPADDSRFPEWVRSVAQQYAGGAMTARARSVVQNALDRTAVLGDSHANRIALLGMMADFWQQDRNLVKTVAYLEKQVAAVEAARVEGPPPATARSVARSQSQFGSGISVYASGRNFGRSPVDANSIYQRLTDFYRQMGRPDDVAAMIAKVRASARPGDNLSSFYESNGLLDEAASVLREQTQRAGTPQQTASNLQSLASFYQRQQRYDEAIAAFQQAEVIYQADGAASFRGQLVGVRQNLANVMQQSGRTADAEKLYQEILSNSQDGDQFQSLSAYASHLSSTNRSAQAEALLKQYQASHSSLPPWQQDALLLGLADAARSAGASDRAEEYLRPVRDKQKMPPPEIPGNAFANELQRAQYAANSGSLAEAFSAAMRAMDLAPRSPGRQQLSWAVPPVAWTLASRKQLPDAELLYQRLHALVDSWSGDTAQPSIQVAQSYAGFIWDNPERQAGLPEAISRYRKLAIDAHGAESGAAAEAIGMALDSESSRRPSAAMPAAAELLAVEEALSGATGRPYLAAVRRVANSYDGNGEPARALELHRKAVSIVDRACAATDPERGSARLETAFALAQQGQFDEAERLAVEAVAIGQAARPPQSFASQLEQVRRMRSVRNDGNAPVSGRWFQGRLY